MNGKHVLIMVLLLSVAAPFLARPVVAACTSNNSGDLPGWGSTVTLSSCNKTISTTTGVDWATLETGTTNTGVLSLVNSSLTLNSGAVLAVGSISLGSGANIAIDTLGDGTIKLGTPLYVADGDNDGWASTAINSATLSESTGAGKRRLAFMRGWTVDCGDSTYSTSNVCCTVATRYQDSDGDGYGNPSVSIQACTTAGYVDNNTDCYDSNANARPGSATCSTTHRGDGSYDFNCSGTNTACGSTYYTNQAGYTTSSRTWDGTRCVTQFTFTRQELSNPVGCGVSGWICTGTTNYEICPGGYSYVASACSALGTGYQGCQ